MESTVSIQQMSEQDSAKIFMVLLITAVSKTAPELESTSTHCINLHTSKTDIPKKLNLNEFNGEGYN